MATTTTTTTAPAATAEDTTNAAAAAPATTDAQTSANPGVQNEKPAQTNATVTNGKPKETETSGEKQKQDGEKPKDDGKDKSKDGGDDKPKDDQPPGGFDDTPIPSRPAGYTVKFTFHRATNLPMADINAMSSDPYILAQLNTEVPTRHKEDPPLRHRTKTIRRTTTPEWNEEWIVANVPSSGFKLKLRVFDEDPADKDDLLGKIQVSVPSVNERWEGIKQQDYKVRAKQGSRRAYLLQALTTCFREDKHFRGQVWLSAEVLGRTQSDGQNGRLYTVGPCRWIRHYSPILGRLAHTKEPNADEQNSAANQKKSEKEVERYNFQANQMQLDGPVPAELYHRFVEFKPWVGRMFTGGGLSGFLLGKALHHQHSRVYNFGRSTVYGDFPQGPSPEMTKKFLELVHYDEGGRIFTYVLTLDALWRFTETGKEFGIDMLSKHTMHSDVSIYIAFSGEFFIRRLKHANRPPPPEPTDDTSRVHPPDHAPNESHPPKDNEEISGPDGEQPTDPQHYELVIDNDSGTYRPNAKKLPLLKDFLSRSLPGLHVMVLDCQADEEKMTKMKDEQRERKKKEGDHIIYTQGNRSGSISSSDDEDLDAVEAGITGDQAREERGALGAAARATKQKQKARFDKAKRNYGGIGRASEDEKEGAEGRAENVPDSAQDTTEKKQDSEPVKEPTQESAAATTTQAASS